MSVDTIDFYVILIFKKKVFSIFSFLRPFVGEREKEIRFIWYVF